MQNVESTILSQYANSPTINRLIYNLNQYIDPSADITLWYNDLWNISTATGYGLDVWGRIVGVNRVLQVAPTTYFGFTGPAGASGTTWNNGIFYEGEALTTNYSLTDASFRILILAKALFNISNGSIPATNQILVNLFGPNGLIPLSGNAFVNDNLNMTLTYFFGQILTPLALSIVQQSGVIPRPAGVLATIGVSGGGFINDGGFLVLPTLSGYPTTQPGTANAFWSDGLFVKVAPGGSYNSSHYPLYYYLMTPTSLIALDGSYLPRTAPTTGSGQLWLNGTFVCIA